MRFTAWRLPHAVTLTRTFGLFGVVPLLASCIGDGSPPGPSAPETALVASVELVPSTANLQVGDTLRLVATTRDAADNILTGRPVSWSSDHPSVATVSATGLVTGVGGGQATIAARVETREATAGVEVTHLERGSGDHVWSFAVEGKIVERSTPAVGPDGTIYVISSTGRDGHTNLYALTSAGALRWEKELGEGLIVGSAAGTPVVARDGSVYVSALVRDEHNQSFIQTMAFDSTGKLLWTLDDVRPVASTNAGVYLDGGTAIVIREPDGTLRPLSDRPVVGSVAAVLPDGAVLMTGQGRGDEVTLLAADGAVRWTYWNPPRGYDAGRYDGDRMRLSGVAVAADGSTIFTSSSLYQTIRVGRLTADGILAWQRDWWTNEIGSGCYGVSPPVIGPDGTVYVARGRYLTALDADGSGKWSYNLESHQEAAPAISAEGLIYGQVLAKSDDFLAGYPQVGKVYALDLDGHLQWGAVGGNVNCGPSANVAVSLDGLVLVPEEDNTVLAAYAGGGGLAGGVWPKAHGDAGNRSSR